MTKNNNFKKQIRARMEQTGETYTEARKHLIDAFTARRPDSFYLNEGYLLGNTGPRSALRTDQLFSETDTRALAQLLPRHSHGGLIVFTGESDAGKTHTMNAVLNTYLDQPGTRVIGIENDHKGKLETPDDALYIPLSPTGMYQDYFDDISELAYQTMRMVPNLVAITEPPTRNNELLWLAERASETGHEVFLELTSPSLAQTVLRLSGRARSWQYENISAIVEQQKFVFNSRNFFLRSVLVFDKEMQRVATEYAESLDEEKFYAQLRAHGVNPLSQPK